MRRRDWAGTILVACLVALASQLRNHEVVVVLLFVAAASSGVLIVWDVQRDREPPQRPAGAGDIRAGGSIRAGSDIAASRSIQAGESVEAGGSMQVGPPASRLLWMFVRVATIVGVALIVWLSTSTSPHRMTHVEKHRPSVSAEHSAALHSGSYISETQLEAGLYAGNVTKKRGFEAAGTTAAPDDDVAVEAFFMNVASPNSGLVAVKVRLKIDLDESEETKDHVIRMTVSALDGPKAEASTHVLTALPSRLALVPGSVTWKHDVGSDTHPRWVTIHRTDWTIMSPIGTVIDAAEMPANNFSETVVFRVAVAEAGATNLSTP